MLSDIDKETVDFIENFDGSLKEPTVLPAKIPNLLVNGSSGIAVGMATNIPPHNLKEICSGIIALIENPDIEINEILDIITGPDFPTGGSIIGRRGIRSAFTTGRGSITLRAKMDIEEKASKKKIIVTEIPYQVNKSLLLEHMAQGVNNKVIEGISDIRDESDRNGMRIVIELKKSANEEVVKNQLLKHTRLQNSFGIIMLGLHNGQPRTFNIKELLKAFLDHRFEIVTKRTEYELKKAQEKAHVLEGLLIALDNLDAVIALIKKSENAAVAKEQLMSNYELSEIQSQAILDMKLQKLTGLEQNKIREEHKKLLELITELQKILSDKKEIFKIIKQEMEEVISKYGDERKTIIEEGEEDFIEIEDLIKPEDNVITISNEGYAKRQPMDTYKTQNRGGKGIIGATTKDEDFVKHLFIANTKSYLLVFTDKGKIYWLKVYTIPEAGRTSKGRPLINLVEIEKDEKVRAVIPIREFEKDNFLVFATRKGLVKKTSLDDYSKPRKGGIIAINLNEDDNLVDVSLTNGKEDLILASSSGQAVRFSEDNVRSMGRNSSGVRGIKLSDKDDKVVGMIKGDTEKTILTITENGYGKRSKIEDYRLINRGGKGVRNIICSSRNGRVTSVRSVDENDEIMIISKNGILIRTSVQGINVIGRNTQGVRIMNLKPGDKVISVAKIENPEEETN
jgi:DNA gyrase subunit A